MVSRNVSIFYLYYPSSTQTDLANVEMVERIFTIKEDDCEMVDSYVTKQNVKLD